jgi:hypothetical protein
MMLATVFTSFLIAGCVLLVVTVLPTEATPAPSAALPDSISGTRSPRVTDREKYKLLRAAILEYYPGEKLIQEFKLNAYCPFQVLTVNSITRIMCDISQIRNCTSNRDYCRDISNSCHQAYINAYVAPSARHTEKVEIGCIYHPSAVGLAENFMDTPSDGILVN